MKRLLMIALLATVSWAVVGTPAQAAETSRYSLHPKKHFGKHPKHPKKHKKHKKH